MIPYYSNYGGYNTLTFSGAFPTFDEFKDFREELIEICPAETITEADLKVVYLLLLTRYGESHFVGYNLELSKMKVIQLVGAHAPYMLQKLRMQNKLATLDLDSDELTVFATDIVNHADHPNQEPSTASLEELTYIDSQSTQKRKRGILEAYSLLNSLLDDGVQETFLNKFGRLFVKIAQPQVPLLYENDIDDGE